MSRPSFRQIQALSHTARRRGADYARLAVLEIHPPLRVLIARLRPSPSALLLPVTAAVVGVALITTTLTGAIRGPESPIELVPPSPPKVTNPAGPYDSSRPNPKRSAVALPARPADAADNAGAVRDALHALRAVRDTIPAADPAVADIDRAIADLDREQRSSAVTSGMLRTTRWTRPVASTSKARTPPVGKQGRTVRGAAKAIDYARAQLGKPYRWGGEGPGSFDCSGLMMRSWQAGGVRLPRTAAAQYHATKRVSRSELLPGDLVFSNGLGHVRMYIGNGKTIEAPRSGLNVRIRSLLGSGIVGYGRVASTTKATPKATSKSAAAPAKKVKKAEGAQHKANTSKRVQSAAASSPQPKESAKSVKSVKSKDRVKQTRTTAPKKKSMKPAKKERAKYRLFKKPAAPMGGPGRKLLPPGKTYVTKMPWPGGAWCGCQWSPRKMHKNNDGMRDRLAPIPDKHRRHTHSFWPKFIERRDFAWRGHGRHGESKGDCHEHGEKSDHHDHDAEGDHDGPSDHDAEGDHEAAVDHDGPSDHDAAGDYHDWSDHESDDASSGQR